MNILATYRTHQSVEDMDKSVENHVSKHKGKLTSSDIKVLRCLASHSLKHVGACKLKGQTIADEIGISRSTVTRCIKKLRDLNIIESHTDTKSNGIKGANIYSIIFLSHSEPSNEPTKMNHRAVHETPRSSKVEHVKHEPESFSFNQSLNPFVVKNVVNNVNACAMQGDLKSQLRDIYNPQSVEGNQAFEELSKIAFGRIKQFMRTHQVPYLQMEQIILKAMNDLVRKQGVRNQFAMYSKMIERQTLQLFEKFIQPVQAVNKPSREIVPEWFEKRNEPSTVVNNDVDYEAERQKILAKLG